MSLIDRKPRPIPSRDKDPDRLRDDRLFIIACDDTYAPDQYFGFFKFARVRIHVIPTVNGASVAEAVLAQLLKFDFDDDDERWMVLDTDHLIQGSHLRGLRRALRDAKNNGVKVAFSRPCFEFWLMLHHMDENLPAPLRNAGAVEAALRSSLGEYNKTNLKREHFPLSAVALACERAEKLDRRIGGGVIPHANTSRVYLIWKAIAAKSLPSQFPVELHSLLPHRSGAVVEL
jgi:hypothetical protein